MLLFICIPIESVYTQGGVNVTLESGIDGLVKPREGFPLTVTLENQMLRDINGILEITGIHEQLSIRKAVEIEKSATKTIVVSLPEHSRSFRSSPNDSIEQIRLIEDGKDIPLTGDLSLDYTGTSTEAKIIGYYAPNEPLDSTEQGHQYLKNNDAMILHVERTDFPDESVGLSILDMLIMDLAAVSTLTAQQQEAITSWVGHGGTLVFGGQGEVTEEQDPLYDLLPVPLTTGDSLSIETIEAFPVEPPPGVDYIRLESLQLPRFANETLGSGHIFQLPFSTTALGLTHANNENLPMQAFLNHALSMDVTTTESSASFPKRGSFPSTPMPLWGVIVMMSVLTFIAIPSMWFLFTRLKKERYLWWVVPSISLLLFTAIVLIGAKDRLWGMTVNEVSIVNLHPDGSATGEAGISLLTSVGGDKTVRFNESVQLDLPVVSYYPDEDVPLLLRYDGTHTQGKLDNTSYWSDYHVKGNVFYEQIGLFQGSLRLEDGMLAGELTNETTRSYSELILLYGDKAVFLGHVGRGQHFVIDEDISTSLVRSPTPVAFGALVDYGVVPEEQRQVYDRLIGRLGLYVDQQTSRTPAPFLVGLTRDIESFSDIEDAQTNQLVLQKLQVDYQLEGQVEISEKDLIVSIEGDDSKRDIHIDEERDILSAEPGTYTFNYKLPVSEELDLVKWKRMNADLSSHPSVSFLIYNREENAWEAIEQEMVIKPYLSAEDTFSIRLEISHEINGPRHPEMPMFTLEGEVRSDE
ncbi:hypothetical protein [Aureibacillus halotolerans]|uniref:hypothetical protein n=1 Tax=Aureibacillus halotolerans TaxID=1508390 RepID=UPI00105C399B|nr:hypothetical protein [Aureibacillus halotolerans]